MPLNPPDHPPPKKKERRGKEKKGKANNQCQAQHLVDPSLCTQNTIFREKSSPTCMTVPGA